MTGELGRTRGLQAVALCLEYPDDGWRHRMALLREVAATLPGPAAAAFTRFLDHADTTPSAALARHYVETFDLRRRCCLYLTYYAFGDTRKRGMALLRFTHVYRSAGFTVGSDELPDHLAVVCEFAARSPAGGLSLLADNRAGVELLYLALTEVGSPYADVLAALRLLLPDPAPRDLQRALELARTGPPAEEVGLEPFAPPEHAGARR
jgi:nitrate reductase molybdenum cofactor assembly chaperone NarJ/NarW